jgi:hypothetical protein
MDPTIEGSRGKMLINVKNKGLPLVPSRNQWHAALKGHALHYLDITKSINVQHVEKMEKVKKSLDQ